jgi:hypothetical protein
MCSIQIFSIDLKIELAVVLAEEHEEVDRLDHNPSNISNNNGG